MTARLIHYWECACAASAYLRRRMGERSTIVSIGAGVPLMYAAPTPFWQGVVAVFVVAGVLMPSPPKGGCNGSD
jgi:hypothetical protein